MLKSPFNNISSSEPTVSGTNGTDTNRQVSEINIKSSRNTSKNDALTKRNIALNNLRANFSRNKSTKQATSKIVLLPKKSLNVTRVDVMSDNDMRSVDSISEPEYSRDINRQIPESKNSINILRNKALNKLRTNFSRKKSTKQATRKAVPLRVESVKVTPVDDLCEVDMISVGSILQEGHCSAKEESSNKINAYQLYLEGRRLCVDLLDSSSERDVPNGLKLLESAANMGSPDAKYLLGVKTQSTDFKKEKCMKVKKWFIESALSGHVGAMFELYKILKVESDNKKVEDGDENYIPDSSNDNFIHLLLEIPCNFDHQGAIYEKHNRFFIPSTYIWQKTNYRETRDHGRCDEKLLPYLKEVYETSSLKNDFPDLFKG